MTTIKKILDMKIDGKKFGLNINGVTVSKFKMKTPNESSICEMLITDETGTTGFSIWEGKPGFGTYKDGDILNLTGVYAKHDDYREKNVVCMPKNGSVEKVGKGEVPSPVQEESTDSGDATKIDPRQVMSVPAKTDLTPIVQELGKIVIVLQDIHERFDTSIKVVESMNMKMKDLVDAFQVSRSPEVDESLTAVVENIVDEKLGMFKQRTEAGIEALKEDIKDMKKELKKLGKK